MGARTKLELQPIDKLAALTRRRPLLRTRQAIEQGDLCIGFIGGSITAGWDNTWPGPVMAWLAEAFPEVILSAENAAIGATGSDSACARVDREIIQPGCHLTFVEYAVNDYERPTERRERTREGLIRKLLASQQDVVLVYTFRQEMYAEMIAGTVPASIAEFERLGEHYGLSSVWVGLHALNEVRSGRMTWADWLPDSLHPGPRGSWSYAQAVTDFLRTELSVPGLRDRSTPALPAPLSPLNWQSATILPLNKVQTRGPWILKTVHTDYHVTRVLETHTPGASLSFNFAGRGLALVFDYGKRSAELQYRIDGGEWIPIERERPSWAGNRGMVRALTISDLLENGKHSFEMEVVHGNRADCQGTECRLALVCVL